MTELEDEFRMEEALEASRDLKRNEGERLLANVDSLIHKLSERLTEAQELRKEIIFKYNLDVSNKNT